MQGGPLRNCTAGNTINARYSFESAPPLPLPSHTHTSSSLWLRMPRTRSCRFLSNMRSMLPFTIFSAIAAAGPREGALGGGTGWGRGGRHRGGAGPDAAAPARRKRGAGGKTPDTAHIPQRKGQTHTYKIISSPHGTSLRATPERPTKWRPVS